MGHWEGLGKGSNSASARAGAARGTSWLSTKSTLLPPPPPPTQLHQRSEGGGKGGFSYENTRGGVHADAERFGPGLGREKSPSWERLSLPV